MNNSTPQTNLDYLKLLWRESTAETRRKWLIFLAIVLAAWLLGALAASSSVAALATQGIWGKAFFSVLIGPLGLLWGFLKFTGLIQETVQEPSLAWLLLFAGNGGICYLLVKIAVSEPDPLVQEQRRLQTDDKAQGRLPIKEIGEKLQITEGVLAAEIEVDKKKRVTVGIDYQAGEGHMLVVGPTRSGKGLHLTQTLLQWPGAALIIDPKGEQFARTAGEREKRFGSPIYQLPGNQVHLAYYYDSFRDRDSLYELHDHLLRPQQSRDRIFADKSRVLFSAAYEYALAHDLNPLRVLLDMADGNPIMVLTALETVPAAKEYVRLFTDGLPPEKLHENRFATSAYGTFTTMLGSYQKHIDTIAPLRNNPLVIPRDWVAQGATIYITYSLNDLQGVGGVVAATLAALMRYQMRQQRKKRLLVAVDELPVIGLANIATYLATVGGYGITMLLYAQAISQLRQLYHTEGTQSILANCIHQVWYPPADIETAKIMSELYGTTYKPSHSQGSSRRFYQGGAPDSKPRDNYVDMRQAQSWDVRPSLGPNELMSLPQEKVLVLMHKGRQYRFIGERLNPISLLDSLPPPPVLPQLKVGVRQYTQWHTAKLANSAGEGGPDDQSSLTSADHF
ncbi:MAG: type IV secretory system conjugative DNA transfer family protein [Anaerolineae bacterium]|nr:type IV secretory system conjugative DNA transfer family protein [Anaerolineae bacterium]